VDLRQLRTDLSVVGASAGFNAWNVEPDDPQHLPAMVVGGVRSMRILTIDGGVEVEISATFYANAADNEDATATLDMVLSIGTADSFLDWLLSVKPVDEPAWRSVRFVQAGPYHEVALPGSGTALAVEVVLSFTA